MWARQKPGFGFQGLNGWVLASGQHTITTYLWLMGATRFKHCSRFYVFLNHATTARQEYRTLWGLNFIWVLMRLLLAPWSGHRLSVPVGLSLDLKESQAKQLKRTYR
jgi:hypothetical protein